MPAATPNQLYLLDGSNIFYRCYHAPFRNLSVPCPKECGGAEDCSRCEGTGHEPTKATWLFTRQLLQIIRDKKPKYLAVLFDGDRSALERRKLYPAYKANRGDKPGGVRPQMKRIKQIVEALGIHLIQCDGYEADDAIATLAVRYASPECEVVILSRDKDLGQLCTNPDIFCFDPLTAEWRAKKTAGKKFGVRTSQLIDFFVLTGDASDNIPGVGGFGGKTAAKYLQRYKNIEDMVIAATMGHLPQRLAEKLVKAHASGWVRTSRRLIRLDTQVALDISPSDLVVPKLRLKNAGPIFRVLRFENMG